MSTDRPDEESGSTSLYVSAAITALFGLFAALHLTQEAPGTGTELAFLMSAVCFISVVIWQATDPFADAAQWVGTRLQLPGSVRGATLDAVASSMPELFSGIFFVVVAMTAAGDSAAEQAKAGAEGYGSTIATCAGSAVYNMILIPAFCALVISFSRKSRPTIDVEPAVIRRDGFWFVGCEILLIVFLWQQKMHWWMAIVFFALYAGYIINLAWDARAYRRQLRRMGELLPEKPETSAVLAEMGLPETPHYIDMVEKARAGVKPEDVDAEEDEEAPETAGVLFGKFEVPLSWATVPAVLILSTALAAAACYFLVEVTISTADLLKVPAFFVAVILAAAASSVPDTFLAIGAAKRGDDSGAVSNAFGSNIFDICICLAVPLLVNSYLNGGAPVELTQDGKPIPGLVGLQILLVVLTGVTLAMMWHRHQLTRLKAIILCLLYGVFIGYAVIGSLTLDS